MQSERHIGTIKAVRLREGYGFIERRTGHDEFFHCTDLGGGLEFDGALNQRRVTFIVSQRHDGRTKAVDIRPAD